MRETLYLLLSLIPSHESMNKVTLGGGIHMHPFE